MKHLDTLLSVFLLSILLDTVVYCASSAKASESGKIAERKCREYSKWFESPVPNSEKIAGKCGISTEKSIIGGVKAKELEFPHMAHLGYGDAKNISYLCGATLISEEYVLTAAHCIHKERAPSVVRLGAGNPKSQIFLKVKTLIPHPEHTFRDQYNDIALVRLEKPLQKFTDYLRPACIHTTKTISQAEGTATGWGSTTLTGPRSDTLVKISLPFVPHAKCTGSYEKNFGLDKGIEDNSMICAGGLKEDACAGFGGGPLQIVRKEPRCMYDIVGITSFGKGCGTIPGVYTRVSNYVSWIESVAWPGK